MTTRPPSDWTRPEVLYADTRFSEDSEREIEDAIIREVCDEHIARTYERTGRVPTAFTLDARLTTPEERMRIARIARDRVRHFCERKALPYDEAPPDLTPLEAGAMARVRQQEAINREADRLVRVVAGD